MLEFKRIHRLFAPLAGHAGALGLQDDAAIFMPRPGHELVITADAVVHSIHFRGTERPRDIARKALRVNLSDLAAKGATPLGYLLTLMAPKTCDEAWFADISEGLRLDQEEFGITLLGGDTTQSATLALAITAIGEVPAGTSIKRSGARVGDCVFVSGTIGKGVLGLEGVSAHVSHYELPTPRLALGKALRGVASACMDISDGLLQDAMHLARASNVSLQLDLEAIPLADAGVDAMHQLSGGDDYELLFTAPANTPSALLTSAHSIGEVVAGEGIALLEHGKKIALPHRLGFQHF